jgi:adenosine kinase
MSSPAILGMGNPLLDISAEVTQATFDKYGLEPGNAILAEDKHKPLYDELTAMKDVKYIAGGATQNSIRVAQWMLQEPGMTAYMGCIGNDDFGKKLEDACKADGVQAMYLKDTSVPTGKCAVTILDKERSLTTELSAANNYKASHLQESAQMKVLEGAKVVYSAGFFITVSPESMDIASEKTVANKTTYCLNLSAPFISRCRLSGRSLRSCCPPRTTSSAMRQRRRPTRRPWAGRPRTWSSSPRGCRSCPRRAASLPARW